MALTLVDAETILTYRVGSLLAAAGLDSEPIDNLDLNDPIGRAVRACGYTTTDVIWVVDADVAQVPVAKYDKFLDYATLFTLEAILGNLDMTDITVGPRSEKLSQLATQVEKMIIRLRKRLGDDLLEPEAGYITINLAEHD